MPETPNSEKPITSESCGPLEAAKVGFRSVLALPGWQKAVLAAGLILLALMLPVGRAAPDAGGLLAPLTVDSGYLLRQAPGMDFYSIYQAGARALSGGDPYASGVREFTGVPYATDYRYPPTALVVLAIPLNVLPAKAAYTVWVAFLFVCVIANFLLCMGRRPSAAMPLALIWFAWFPLIAEFHLGQFSLFVGTLLLWGIDGMTSRRNAWGLAWVAAVFIKVFPLAMAASLFFWGRKKIAVAAVAILFASIALWHVSTESAFKKSFVDRDVKAGFISHLAQPYAGAQGVQSFVNATIWRGLGFTHGKNPDFRISRGGIDPVYFAVLAMIVAYSTLCLWVVWSTRREFSLEAIGLLWLAWFYLYRDCWEHHYAIYQCLLALLLARSVISWRVAIACWIFAGAPSLWWPWYRAGYSGNWLAETLGTLYFFQRPIGVLLLTGILLTLVSRDKQLGVEAPK